MKTADIRARFRHEFKIRAKLMTRTVVRYGKRGDRLYELSKVHCIDVGDLYAVTVIHIRDECDHISSRCFHSLAAAEAYIDRLAD